MKRLHILLSLILFSLIFTSCNKQKEKTELCLDNSLYWCIGTESDTLYDAKNYFYSPLKAGFMNLFDLVGREPVYIWVKIPFKLPENLTNQNLGFVIPYLHFAEKVWLNDTYIGKTGNFYPDPYSILYSSHFFLIPEQALNKDNNYFYIKILSQGLGTISEGIILDEYNKAQYKANKLNFYHSKIYLIFEGVLICAIGVFFLIFMAQKKQFHIFTFTILLFCSSIFLIYFFLPELPGFNNNTISFLLLTKLFLCLSMFLTVFSIVSFIINFIKIEQPRSFLIFKHSILAITSLIVLIAPDFSFLMKITIPMIVTYGLHYLLALQLIYKSLSDTQKRHSAIVCLFGASPLTLSLIIDFVVRILLRNIKYPFFTIIGWEITISFFIFYISLKFNHVFVQNEKLNKDLQHEVALQTIDLTYANEKLNQKQMQTEREMDMAAIVQEKFFEIPKENYEGWDLALDYQPLEKVSGDLYDFYTSNSQLNGIALFDASGHGVAAALITMLSKNIIGQEFVNGSKKQLSIAEIFFNINRSIIESKGKIDNYLTGILLRFNYVDSNSAIVDFGNSGHPYPIFYSHDIDDFVDLKSMETTIHYGAVAMNGVESTYSDFSFRMEKGDIIAIFTDGVTEFVNKNKQEFGRKKLEELILNNKHLSAKELMNIIKDSSKAFREDIPNNDDTTLIILKKL